MIVTICVAVAGLFVITICVARAVHECYLAWLQDHWESLALHGLLSGTKTLKSDGDVVNDMKDYHIAAFARRVAAIMMDERRRRGKGC
jgi:hypothetical protein